MTGTRSVQALGLALLLAALALFVLADRAVAAPPPGAVYEGVSSDGDQIKVTISSDATIVDVLITRNGMGCGPATLSLAQPLPASPQFTLTWVNTPGSKAAFTGFFALPGYEAIAGAFSDEPVNCPKRASTWTATRVPAPPPPRWPLARDVAHTGGAFSVEGTRIGDASFTQTPAGASVSITAEVAGCKYQSTLTGVDAGLAAGAAASITVLGSGGRAVAIASPTGAGGGFVLDAPSSSCPKLSGMWIGQVPKPGFVSPPNFSFSTNALVVFSGGTVAELEAAAKAAGGKGVWVQDSTGAYALLVVDGPAFINDPFRSRFTTGLAKNTAVTLTK